MNRIVIFLSVLCVAYSVAAAESFAQPDSQSRLDLKQLCVRTMNTDPQFAASIVATVDRQIDNKTLAAHADADYHIRKNQRHVVYAYAAMWLIAVAFVWFLFRRQVALQTEIEALRRDLDAAAKESA